MSVYSGCPGYQDTLDARLLMDVKILWISGNSKVQDILDVRLLWMSRNSECQATLDVRI